MTTKTDEQERAAFEAHFSKPPFEWEFHRYGEDSAWPGNYQQYEHQCAWEGYQAGRAALQSQDREDEVEYQLGIEGEVQAQTFGPRDQAWAEIQRYAAQYAEDGPIEIWEIARRRIEDTDHA